MSEVLYKFCVMQETGRDSSNESIDAKTVRDACHDIHQTKLTKIKSDKVDRICKLSEKRGM